MRLSSIISIGVAALLTAGLCYAVKEKKQEWIQANNDYLKTLDEIEKEIKNELRKPPASSASFEALNNLYYISFQTANQAYGHKKNADYIVQENKKIAREAKQKRNEIYDGLDTQSPSEDEIKILKKELEDLKVLRQDCFDTIEKTKSEKENFSTQVREFNNMTHALRVYIRDNCQGGETWFNKIQESIDSKKLAKQ